MLPERVEQMIIKYALSRPKKDGSPSSEIEKAETIVLVSVACVLALTLIALSVLLGLKKLDRWNARYQREHNGYILGKLESLEENIIGDAVGRIVIPSDAMSPALGGNDVEAEWLVHAYKSDLPEIRGILGKTVVIRYAIRGMPKPLAGSDKDLYWVAEPDEEKYSDIGSVFDEEVLSADPESVCETVGQIVFISNQKEDTTFILKEMDGKTVAFSLGKGSFQKNLYDFLVKAINGAYVHVKYLPGKEGEIPCAYGLSILERA